MKRMFSLGLLACTWVTVVTAQEAIYRCGNEYTNNKAQALARGCKLIEGGNVTVVQGPRSTVAPAKPGSGAGTQAAVARARHQQSKKPVIQMRGRFCSLN